MKEIGKFTDILFVTDKNKDISMVNDAPVSSEKKTNKVDEYPNTKNAKEYLYNKSMNAENKEPKKAFIFVEDAKHSKSHDEPEEKIEVEEVINPEFRLSVNLSPMFGVIDEGVDENKTNMAQPKNKNSGSLLGTVFSPIYGVNFVNDLGNSINMSVNKVDKEYEPFIEIEEVEKDDEPNFNDTLTDNDNLFSDDDVENDFKEYVEPVKHSNDNVDKSIYRQVLREEFGSYDSKDIDLFEDIFKEDDD